MILLIVVLLVLSLIVDSLLSAASVRKVARNQIIVPQVARSISVKDVIAVLEREPQMSKSNLIYQLYDKIGVDAAVIE